jgi:hypothetical protein
VQARRDARIEPSGLNLTLEIQPACPWHTPRDRDAGMTVPGYRIDDETAMRVNDGSVEVVSEGYWQPFDPR